MSTVTRRQKASLKTKVTTSKQTSGPAISNYTRVSKSIREDGWGKKSASSSVKDVKLAAIASSSRKRKAVTNIEDDSSADELQNSSSLPSATPKPEKSQTPRRGRGRPAKKVRPQPASLKRARSPGVSDSDESTIHADKLFKKLKLESSPSRASSPLTADTPITSSDADSEIESTKKPCLPQEVLDLITLHTSFLRILSLQHAHNGSNVPTDLRALCPNIARAWGRKKVTETDIRICIGVLNMTTMRNLLSLTNYGRSKTCIELDQTQASSLLDEKKMCEAFTTKLETLWSRFSTKGEADAVRFINSLPKAPITVCSSIAKASPVLAKGQRRLEELKQGIAIKKLEKETKSSAAAAESMKNPDGSKMSLLDRIRYKQLQKAAAPAGLTPAQLARRAALQRADEVAALIGMLSRASAGGQGRISFTMTKMLEKLKDSFRMGISSEDGAACVRLLASEVAPEWLRVVKIGGRENVVIETDRQLSKVEVGRRVQAVLAKE